MISWSDEDECPMEDIIKIKTENRRKESDEKVQQISTVKAVSHYGCTYPPQSEQRHEQGPALSWVMLQQDTKQREAFSSESKSPSDKQKMYIVNEEYLS